MINLCKFGKNPSIHWGDLVQTRGYANKDTDADADTDTDADADADANRIRTKNNMSPPPHGTFSRWQTDVFFVVVVVFFKKQGLKFHAN